MDSSSYNSNHHFKYFALWFKQKVHFVPEKHKRKTQHSNLYVFYFLLQHEYSKSQAKAKKGVYTLKLFYQSPRHPRSLSIEHNVALEGIQERCIVFNCYQIVLF